MVTRANYPEPAASKGHEPEALIFHDARRSRPDGRPVSRVPAPLIRPTVTCEMGCSCGGAQTTILSRCGAGFALPSLKTFGAGFLIALRVSTTTSASATIMS